MLESKELSDFIVCNYIYGQSARDKLLPIKLTGSGIQLPGSSKAKILLLDLCRVIRPNHE